MMVQKYDQMTNYTDQVHVIKVLKRGKRYGAGGPLRGEAGASRRPRRAPQPKMNKKIIKIIKKLVKCRIFHKIQEISHIQVSNNTNIKYLKQIKHLCHPNDK